MDGALKTFRDLIESYRSLGSELPASNSLAFIELCMAMREFSATQRKALPFDDRQLVAYAKLAFKHDPRHSWIKRDRGTFSNPSISPGSF